MNYKTVWIKWINNNNMHSQANPTGFSSDSIAYINSLPDEEQAEPIEKDIDFERVLTGVKACMDSKDGDLDAFCYEMAEALFKHKQALFKAQTSTMPDEPGKLAEKFHDIYEKLAPSFGYNTKKASAVEWCNVPVQNKKLMIATCAELLKASKRSNNEKSKRIPEKPTCNDSEQKAI